MAFTCGFFNSQNGDRKYNAEQMASIFDGLIKDGVYDTVGDIFAVTPGTGMQVLVGSGRAWFDHTWNNNDAPYPLAITAADVSLPRYDAVVLETNHSDTVRTNRLRVLTGTPARNPVKPTMTSTANVKQHPLAYIRVTAGATAIKQSMIQVVVGTSECPFVTGIIDTAQIDALFQQWNGEFNEWFDNLKAQLSDNVVANLQGQIDQKVAKADVATTADIKAGTSTTKWVTPKGLKDFSKDVGVYDQTTGAFKNIVSRPIFNINESINITVPSTMYLNSIIVGDLIYYYAYEKVSSSYGSDNFAPFVTVINMNTGATVKHKRLVTNSSSNISSFQMYDSVDLRYCHEGYTWHRFAYRVDWDTAFDSSIVSGTIMGVTANYMITGISTSSITGIKKSGEQYSLSVSFSGSSYPMAADYSNDIIYIYSVSGQKMTIYKCSLNSRTVTTLLTITFRIFTPGSAIFVYDDTYAYMYFAYPVYTSGPKYYDFGKALRIKLSDGSNNLSEFESSAYQVASESAAYGMQVVLGAWNNTLLGITQGNRYIAIDLSTLNVIRSTIIAMKNPVSKYSYITSIGQRIVNFPNYIYDAGRYVNPKTFDIFDLRCHSSKDITQILTPISTESGNGQNHFIGEVNGYIDTLKFNNNTTYPIQSNVNRREITYIQ